MTEGQKRKVRKSYRYQTELTLKKQGPHRTTNNQNITNVPYERRIGEKRVLIQTQSTLFPFEEHSQEVHRKSVQSFLFVLRNTYTRRENRDLGLTSQVVTDDRGSDSDSDPVSTSFPFTFKRFEGP